jgi:hypothetical protein
MQVLVFKTNCCNADQVSKLASCLSAHPQIQRWNVDLHDCDNILRIETEQLQPAVIESLVNEAGYFCQELE